MEDYIKRQTKRNTRLLGAKAIHSIIVKSIKKLGKGAMNPYAERFSRNLEEMFEILVDCEDTHLVLIPICSNSSNIPLRLRIRSAK